jgi:hypothetical protein
MNNDIFLMAKAVNVKKNWLHLKVNMLMNDSNDLLFGNPFYFDFPNVETASLWITKLPDNEQEKIRQVLQEDPLIISNNYKKLS